jgi:hypothetical protein
LLSKRDAANCHRGRESFPGQLLLELVHELDKHIARRANAEDGCTRHFWGSRFRSQALLDERAVDAGMANVDINPIRAGIAQTLQTVADDSGLQHVKTQPRSARSA